MKVFESLFDKACLRKAEACALKHRRQRPPWAPEAAMAGVPTQGSQCPTNMSAMANTTSLSSNSIPMLNIKFAVTLSTRSGR